MWIPSFTNSSFISFRFIGELPSTGGVVTTFSIESVKLRSVFWRDGITILVIGVIFYLFILYYTLVEIFEVIRIGFTNYVHILWNFVDFLIIVVSGELCANIFFKGTNFFFYS